VNSTEFVNLFNSIYNRKIDSSYYYWRFGRQRSNGRIFFAHDEQGLKGCVGLHLLDMNGFTAALVVDAMIDKQCRDNGRTFASLSSKMNKCARANDAKALFMLPNERGTHAWSGDWGWRTLYRVPTYTRDTCQHPGPKHITVFSPGKFDTWAGAIATIFKRTHPELIAVVREETYLNWRFDNPMRDYTIMQVYRQKEHNPFGYMALKIFTDPQTGQSIGDVVDILWAKDDPGTLIDMLYTALDYFHKQGVPKAAMWLQTNTILDSIGHYLGFTSTESGRYFCVKILDDDYTWLNNPARWYLTMADSEVY
jgi:hypothetical protein